MSLTKKFDAVLHKESSFPRTEAEEISVGLQKSVQLLVRDHICLIDDFKLILNIKYWLFKGAALRKDKIS